jgi:hypothetical protein
MRSTFGTLVVTFPLVMLQWMPRAVAQDAVTLWTGNATYTQIAHLRDADTTVDWTRTATVTFDVDSTRNIKRDTLVMFHSLNGVWRERGQEIMSLHHLGYPGAEARSVLPKEIEYNQPAAMSVKTCEPALSATSGLPENTFHLGLVATPQVQFAAPGAPIGTNLIRLGLGIGIPFAYKHDQTEINAEVEASSVGEAGPIGPFTGVGPNPFLKPAKVTVTLKRRNLALEYVSSSDDVLGLTAKKGSFTPVNPNYAIQDGGGGWFLHGNNRVQIKVDGQDVSRSFSIERLLRDWEQPTDQSGGRVGKISVNYGWTMDSTALRFWSDVPGESFAIAPNSWPQQRYMQEYLVGISQFPEFGALYFNVVIDTKPNWYRVRMYPAKTITIDEWCTIKKAQTPYRNETNSGQATIDTGWLAGG